MPRPNHPRPGPTVFERLESRELFTMTVLDAEIAAVAARNSVGLHSHLTRAVAATPTLSVGNPDFLPFSDRLIFNNIQKKNTTYGDTTHTINDLLISNTGKANLIVKSITFASKAPWVLVSPPAFPLTILPGHSVNLKVKFTATSVPPHTTNETNDVKTTNLVTVQKAGGVWNGSLTIATNDPVTPSKVVTLAGYYQLESEHENEPGLQTIINLLGGWTTNLDSVQQPDFKEVNSPVYYGEEVQNNAFWQAADPTKPVLVRDLATFHNEGNLSGMFWYPKGKAASTATRVVIATADEGQSLLPHNYNNPTQYAYNTFKPGTTPFAFRLDGESTDDRVNLMGANKGGGHHVRAWPVRDRNGKIEPGNYFFSVDYSNTIYENFDFNDNVFYVENVKPVGK